MKLICDYVYAIDLNKMFTILYVFKNNVNFFISILSVYS